MITLLKFSIRLRIQVCISTISLCLVTCIISEVSAQQTDVHQGDIVQTALNNAVSMYDKELRRNTFIYSGRSYYDPHAGVKGHQFFNEDYWEQGRVVYDNNVYDSIYLKYDIYKDQLIIENFNSHGFLSPIIIYSLKISSFDLMGHHFIRLKKDTISNLKEGFYDQMYSSNELELIVKRKKEIVNSNSVNTTQGIFSQKDKYYIKKDELFHQVKRKKSIVKVLADHKKEIKNFIKKNYIYFRDNPDTQIFEVVKYYDSLP